MGKGGIKRSLPVIIIAIVCIIAFRDVVFLKETLKFDILDGYLPGHYFASECLRNNLFPLWNPYQQLGFPLYADMLHTNYIVDMFIGRLFPYTNITFHILFILYVILAGIGAYKLARAFHVNNRLSLMAGIAFCLSGFITGNAQHIQFIIGAAWLPFSILYFIRFSRKPELISALLFVIYTYLLVTGGYPSFAIILAYGMIPVFLYFLIRRIKNKDKHFTRSYVLYGALVVVLLVVLCSGIIISIKQATPYVERYVQLTYEYAVTNPFPPSALISMIAPFVTAVHPELFPTDISMNNHYFGVIILILFIYSVSQKISRTGIILLLSGGILLVFSFGDHAFLHRIFFEYVPLFNKFRHPSSFRFITILILLLFTGIQVSKFDPSDSRFYGRFRMIYIISIITITLICAISSLMILIKAFGPIDFIANWDKFLQDFGIFGPLFIQTFIILAINLPFIFLVIIRKKQSLFYPLINFILIAEVIVITGLNMEYTVTSHYDPLDIRAFLRNSPSGFPLPDTLPVSKNTDESVAHVPLIHNTNTYSKTVSADFMYPFVLDGFRQIRNDSTLINHLVDQSVFYLEDHNPGDTVICNDFNPRKMIFSIKAQKAGKAVLLQNFFPGWTAKIDGKETDHFLMYGAVTGINVPSGNHRVEFAYRNPMYVIATLGSFGLFILIILTIQILLLKKTEKLYYAHLLFIGLIIAATLVALIPRKSYAEIRRDNYGHLKNYIREFSRENNVLMVFNTETMEPFLPHLSGKKFIHERFRNYKDLRKLWERIDTTKFEKLVYIWENIPEPAGLNNLISLRFPLERVVYSSGRARITEFTAGKSIELPEIADYLNYYENLSEYFTNEGTVYDSTVAFSGKFSERLSGERLFSSTFRKTLNGEATDVFAMVRFRLGSNLPAHLVISVDRKGKNISYDAVDLREFQKDENGWNTAFIARNFLKSTLKKGDKLVVYCWNSGRNQAVYLDDFYVKL